MGWANVAPASVLWYAGRMALRGARTLVVCLAFVGAVGGCDKKTRECNAVVEAINGVEASAKRRVASDAKADASALKAIADAEDAANRELGKAQTTAPELGALKTKFVAAFTANASASRQLATELEHIPDAAGEKALAEKSNAARDAIETAEGHIAARCQEKTDACTAFAATLKKHPDPDAIDAGDAAKTKAWADAVGVWSNEIAKTEVNDTELRQELDKLRKGYTDLAGVIADVARMSTATKSAQDAQSASAKDIAALIVELNAYCQAP